MKRKIIKIIALFTLLICGITTTDWKVNAAEDCRILECEYDTKLGKIKLSCENWHASGAKPSLSCQLSSANEVAGIGIEGKIKIKGENMCPNFYVYEKLIKAGTTHVLISEDVDISSFMFALTHPTLHEKGVEFATPEPNVCDTRKACSQEVIQELQQKKEAIYQAQLTNPFNDMMNALDSKAAMLGSETTVEICRDFRDNTVDISKFAEGANAVAAEMSKAVQEVQNSYSCTFDEDTINNLINYHSSRNTTTFVEKASSYKNSVLSKLATLTNECESRIPNLKEEEQDSLNNEMDQTRSDLDDQFNQVIEESNDKINEMVDHLTKLNFGTDVEITCQGIIGDKLLDEIKKIFGYIQIAAPILLIVLGSVDFAQVVISDDQEALKKATSKFIKRAIVCVLIFFIPLIVNYILGFIENMTTDPTCGIK